MLNHKRSRLLTESNMASVIVLIALFAYFLSGLLAFNTLFVTASNYVEGMEEGVRQERLMKDIKEARHIYSEFNNEYLTTMEKLYGMEDAKWTEEYVSQTVDRLNQKRHRTQQALLDLRFKFTAELTKDEWDTALLQTP